MTTSYRYSTWFGYKDALGSIPRLILISLYARFINQKVERDCYYTNNRHLNTALILILNCLNTWNKAKSEQLTVQKHPFNTTGKTYSNPDF